MSDPAAPIEIAASSPPDQPRYRRAFVLFALTCVSTTYVALPGWPRLTAADGDLQHALAYSVPLMAILLAHELGHYIAARIHRVPASLPYFIPIPWPPLGTMGAVIFMRDRIASRNALLDIGAAGPLAGLCVALPVLIYGIAQSKVAPLPPDVWFQEGHSLLYLGLLRWLKGPIPPGHDIMLSPTAFAGWAGLLVTMINLIPALQLDGGHVAYALLGDRYPRLSRFVRAAVLPLALGVALWLGAPAFAAGRRGEALWNEAGVPGMQWFVWWLLLSWMARRGEGEEHPPTDPGPLSPGRRAVAIITLLLFVALFMPAWMRMATPS
jgi:membrane-associated protease RseP (regulator of RpoE activity)